VGEKGYYKKIFSRAMAQNLMLAAASIILALLVSEAVFRVVEGKDFTVKRPELKFFLEYDQTYGWRNRPGASGKLTSNPETSPYRVEINSRGLRGQEITYEKPEGVKRRILLVGDSLAFGYGLEEADSLSADLKGMLPPDYEVINGGVVGYGIDQSYMLYRNELTKYDQDMTVVVLTAMDIFDVACSVRLGLAKPYFRVNDGKLVPQNIPVRQEVDLPSIVFRGRPVTEFFFRYSALYRFLYGRLVGFDEIYQASRWELGREEASDVFSLILRDIERRERLRGSNALFVVMPYEDWLVRMQPYPHMVVKDTLDSLGVPYIDLWGPFQQHMGEGLYQKGDPGHPSRRGYEIMAREVLKGTQNFGLLEH
jgi:lysophospholipase L1-like esterase